MVFTQFKIGIFGRMGTWKKYERFWGLLCFRLFHMDTKHATLWETIPTGFDSHVVVEPIGNDHTPQSGWGIETCMGDDGCKSAANVDTPPRRFCIFGRHFENAKMQVIFEASEER